MNLQMNVHLADNYKNERQRIRIISENWVGQYILCPCCGNSAIKHFPNNKPVADFYCPICNEEFELKSKSGRIGPTVPDGAYKAMVARIQSTNNPNFFFMSYHKKNFAVQDLILIPKYFFVADIIEKRKPLGPTTHRAGWVGCNILIKNIPEAGKIYLVKNGLPIPMSEVIQKYQKTSFAASYKYDMRGWLLDILNCIEQIDSVDFTLKTMYTFADKLQMKHPNNHHVEDKIRQQLQILRDQGLIEFSGRGIYKKLF